VNTGGVAGGGNLAISAFAGAGTPKYSTLHVGHCTNRRCSVFVVAAANVVISLLSLAVVNVGISALGCVATVQLCLTEITPWLGFAYVGFIILIGALLLYFGEFPFANTTLWSLIRIKMSDVMTASSGTPEERDSLVRPNPSQLSEANKTQILRCMIHHYNAYTTPNDEVSGTLTVVTSGSLQNCWCHVCLLSLSDCVMVPLLEGESQTLPVLKSAISDALDRNFPLMNQSATLVVRAFSGLLLSNPE
jgi:hypothetical protein